MKLPPLPSLRAFEAAARKESFRHAATELGMTAAAVSQHVRTLEDWFGVALFERSARGVRLTAEGRDFSRTVSAGLGAIAEAAEQLSAARQRRQVRLACLPSVVSHWLAPRLPAFRAAHPDIQVTISYSAGAGTPVEAKADLLIQHGVRPSPEAQPILSAATRPTAALGYVERRGPFPAASDLARADLLHDEDKAAWRRWFTEGGIAVPTESGPLFADFNLLVSSVTSGLGVALCPTALIADELARGALQILFERASDTEKYYWLMETDRPTPESVIMRDWLLSESRKSGQPSP